MATPPPFNSSGRETRLLVVTLVLSAVLLLVLARFRFPEAEPVRPALVGGSLDRLAARATYDDLARVISSVERRVYPSTLVLEIEGDDEDIGTPQVPSRPVPALRVRDDMALVALHPAQRVLGVRGQAGPVRVVGRDDIRNVAVVAIASSPAPTLSVAPDASGDGPTRYVAVIEASRSGPGVRPLFLGRLDPVDDPRWGRSLVSVGSLAAAQPGSLLFTLEGDLLGLVVTSAGVRTLVPASLVLEAASALAEGYSRQRGDLGITWQPLTPLLSKATGTSAGVVVASVRGASPAADHLQPGDVVQSIGGRPVRSVPEAMLGVSAVAPGANVPLVVARGDTRVPVELVATQPSASRAADARVLGLTLRATAAGADVIRVAPDSLAGVAGIIAGDRITHVDRAPLVGRRDFGREFEEAAAGRAFLLTVARADGTRVVAIEKP